MSLETSVSNVNQNIPTCAQPISAVAYIGQLALSHPTSASLLAEATSLIAQTLTADLVLLGEMDSTGEYLSLHTQAEWKEGSKQSTQIAIGPDSFERAVLKSAFSVSVDNIKTETRFKLKEFLLAYGVVSGIGLRIGTMEQSLGVLEVFWKQPRSCSLEQTHFLQSVGSIIALHLDLKHKEAWRHTSEHELKKQLLKTQPAIPSGRVEWDSSEIKKRLVESRERERLRLAQELHDNPIQDLYGLMYQLDELKEFVQDAEGLSIVQDFNNIIQTVVNNLRTICAELRPPSLSPFGLEVAIRDHVEKLRKQVPEIQFHLELMQDQQVLSDSLRLCLFRVYQQAINNVVRHAQAADVYIRFRWDEHFCHLEVEDNGSGFEIPRDWVDLVRQERFGLVGLAERVESVHGKLEIVSTPGDGTLLRILVPVR